MKNNFWRQGIILLGVFAAGALLMHWWEGYRENRAVEQPVAPSLAEQNPAEPLPTTEEKTEEPITDTVPSHLSQIDVSDIQTIVFQSGEEFAPRGMENEEAAVFLPSLPVVNPELLQAEENSQSETQPTEDASRISMISAPVAAKVIDSLEKYRSFKRSARGSYPSVDFKKQQILVLESASNLPDKVFEIVSVEEVDGKRLVSYRVNIFGLDKKINTHSVVLIDKKNLPLELKQVL